MTWSEGFDEAELLSLAASLEAASEHPLAGAVVKAARARDLTIGKVEDFRSLTGQGVTGRVSNRTVAIGSERMLAGGTAPSGDLTARAEKLRQDGQTVIFVAIDGKPAGLLAVSDPIKISTPEAIRALRAEGLRIVMLTGDSATTAAAIGRKLGIDDVRAEVLPDQKRDVVRQLQSVGRVVAMAGDGINDAPAIAAAQVGIAMGTGTDIAMESAGVTLVKGDLRGHRPGAAPVTPDDGQYPAESVLCVRLQRGGRSHRGGSVVSVVWPAPQSSDRRRRDEPQLGVRHRERPATPAGERLKPRSAGTAPWLGEGPTAAAQ